MNQSKNEKNIHNFSMANTTEGTPLCSIIATPELRKLLKVGIYRELHKKGLLSKKQLEQLLSNSGTHFEEQ